MSLAAAMFTTAWTMDDGGAGAAEILDEGAIDLDLVEREALQVAQRGIAGAEIVERDPDPELAQLVQDIERGLVVADQHGLGDLELEPAMRQGPSSECRRDVERQRLALELHRRDVDRDANVIRPVRRFRHGGVEHPVAEFVDQAAFLGHRNEIRGRDQCRARDAATAAAPRSS